MRNRPPKRRRRSGPEKGWPNGLNSGRVSRMMPVRESSSKMRVTMASVRPDTGARLLAGGQLTGQDRDENDVVDAEDDLEHRQREEGDPGFGGGEPVHGANVNVQCRIPNCEIGDWVLDIGPLYCIDRYHRRGDLVTATFAARAE